MKAIVISVAQAKAFTKALIGLCFSIGALMNVKPVNDFVTAHVLAPHPRIAPTVTAFLMICALLHEPKVQAIVGIEMSGNPAVTPKGEQP